MIMEKLELKHLAPYLPYGLKIRIGGEIKKMTSVWNDVNDGRLVFSDREDKPGTFLYSEFVFEFYQSAKPILRPLSDLTKEIEHNGEKINFEEWVNEIEEFVIEEQDEGKIRFYLEGESVWCNAYQIPYYITDRMFYYHFDVFELIPKGLAIDINTLYKTNEN